MRYFMQEEGISEIYKELSRHESETSVVVVLDYKIKLEPIQYRQKPVRFTARRA